MNHVPPQELEGCWFEVERGLLQIQRRVGKTTWTPEYVRERLADGFAALFVCEHGFLVLHIDREEVPSLKKFLNVWLAYFKPGRLRAMRACVVPWLREEALRTVGSEDVRFSSPRMGWIGATEFEIHMITWRLKPR